MGATNKFWFNGLPSPTMNIGNDNAGLLYWFNGLPAAGIIESFAGISGVQLNINAGSLHCADGAPSTSIQGNKPSGKTKYWADGDPAANLSFRPKNVVFVDDEISYYHEPNS